MKMKMTVLRLDRETSDLLDLISEQLRRRQGNSSRSAAMRYAVRRVAQLDGLTVELHEPVTVSQ